MKKKGILLAVCTIVGLAVLFGISCFITFDGYCVSLDFARASESLYRGSELMACADGTDEIIDFVIKGNELHIVTISCEPKMFGNTYYNVRAKTTYNLADAVARYDAGADEDWKMCKNLFSDTTVFWRIADDNAAESSAYFDFTYQDGVRRIYYRTE